MISINESWKFLHLQWAAPLIDSQGHCYITISGTPRYGLCLCFLSLWLEDYISQEDWYTMRERITEYRFKNEAYETFCWSKDSVGAKARATFCREQIQ